MNPNVIPEIGNLSYILLSLLCVFFVVYACGRAYIFHLLNEAEVEGRNQGYKHGYDAGVQSIYERAYQYRYEEGFNDGKLFQEAQGKTLH